MEYRVKNLPRAPLCLDVTPVHCLRNRFAV